MYVLVSNLGTDSTHASEQCATATKYKRLYYRAFRVVRVNAANLVNGVERPCDNCMPRVNEDTGERPLQSVDCE